MTSHTLMQRVNLGGSPWMPADTSIQPPVIFGRLSRPNEQCIGVVVGVSARQADRSRNAWSVEREADAVEIARLPGEPVYELDKPSLLHRAAAEVGTSRAWALLYAET